MASSARIDLNADLGEGFGVWQLGDDEALLDVITSANVACGFHAGDPVTMRRVCTLAAARGVAVGAQVGYRDLAGFGRRRIDVGHDDLVADVVYQLAALDGFAAVAGTRVRYLKPHGALYNTAADDHDQAHAVVEAVRLYDSSIPVLGLPGSALESAADEAGVPFVAEAFADRAYTPQGRLEPRSSPDAVHDDLDIVVAQALSIVRDRHVVATDSSTIAIEADSLCLHGDTPGAVGFARAVREALTAAGVGLGAFAP